MDATGFCCFVVKTLVHLELYFESLLLSRLLWFSQCKCTSWMFDFKKANIEITKKKLQFISFLHMKRSLIYQNIEKDLKNYLYFWQTKSSFCSWNQIQKWTDWPKLKYCFDSLWLLSSKKKIFAVNCCIVILPSNICREIFIS